MFKGSFRLSFIACAIAALLGASSGVEAATPVGPKAVVKGNHGGAVSVTVRLLNTDALRVCFKGDGLVDSVAKWRTVEDSGLDRRSVYAGQGCSRLKHDFEAGETVRIRACFADPRRPQQFSCGRMKEATAQ